MKSMARKYSDKQLDIAQQLIDKGVDWDLIHEKLGSGVSKALRMRELRREHPTPATVDVLYCASYYREHNLPSPFDNK